MLLYDNGNESGIPNQASCFQRKLFSTQASCFQRKQVVFNASCFHNRFRVYYRFHIIIVS